MQGTSRSELAVELDRCARLCEDAASLHVERHGDAVRTEVVSRLLLAAAAMDTAGRVVDERSTSSGTALLITLTLVGDAIEAAESRGLDESLLHCVASLRRVAALCERELAT
jgi:hypothetical protein